MGHDLAKALRAAEAHASFESPPDDGLRIVDLLNPYYKGKELEYVLPGTKNPPQFDGLGEVAHQLLTRAPQGRVDADGVSRLGKMRPVIWKAV